MSDSTTLPKRCKKCGETKPATLEYYHLQKDAASGLAATCKVCKQASRRQRYAANAEQARQRARDYRQANPEQFRATNAKYRAANREIAYERTRLWRSQNNEAVLHYSREYHRKHRGSQITKMKLWRAKNRHRRNAYKRGWQKTAKGRQQAAASQARRRARKLALPDTFTPQDWRYCLDYWHGCCAVCGGQLRDLFGDVEPHADHWIPLIHPDCPGTIAANMICLCPSCNLSKQSKLPEAWLVERYGRQRAAPLLAAIRAYFAIVSEPTFAA